jgi:hypothetical protein
MGMLVGNPAHLRFEDTIMTMLCVRDGDLFREADAQDVLDRAQALIAQRFRAGAPVMSSPSRTREFLRLRLGARDHEVFSVLFLDLRGVIAYVQKLSFLWSKPALDRLLLNINIGCGHGR